MFLVIIFLVIHVCVNAKYYEVKQSRSQNNILRNLSPNSGIDLRALKHLAKVFPNHAIEIQIQGSQYDGPNTQNKYMKNHRLRENHHSYQKWPYRLGRSGENPYLDKSLLANAGSSNQILPTTTTTRTTTMTTKLETSPTSDIRHPYQPTDEQRRPLYMEDLIQALEDFEKKLAITVDHGNSTRNYADRPVVKKDLWDLEKILNCKADTESGNNDHPAIPLTDHRNMAVKNFHDVVRLINKGVKIKLEVTTPRHRDSNVKWVPIKVPKEIM